MTELRKQKIIGPISSFDEIKVVQRTPLIELKSAVDNISVARNVTTINGSATATVENSEYNLSTTALANDSIILDSAERGRYLPGYECRAGLGIRVPNSPAMSGQMEQRWGYYDESDGWFFGEDATGIFVCVRRAGVDTKTYQSNWNQDKLDGTGLSGATLDLTDGNIFEINFSWYGFGVIEFAVIIKNINNDPYQKPVTCHTLDLRGSTSIEQPNLPLRVEVLNGTTATAQTLYVAGRQFTISGKYNPNYRLTGDFRSNVSLTTTFKPIVSFRRKGGSKFLAQSVKLANFEALAQSNTIIGFILNGSLTGASWNTPTSHTPTETVIESDISSTAITGGVFIGGVHLLHGSNKGQIITNVTGFDFDFIETQSVTLVARAVTGTTTLDVATLNVREEW